MKAIFRVLCLIGFTAMTLGCWNSGTPDGKVKVSEDGNNVTVDVAGPGGGKYQAGESVKLPADFPKDVPIYSGAKAKAVTTVQQAQNVHFEVSAAMEKVADFYDTEMPRQGWKVIAAFRQPESCVFSGEKGKRTVTVGLSRSEGVVQINITMSEKTE
jgi:hypothetical protein